MAINWSTLGANIPSQYSKDYQPYNLNPDAFSKGMESIGNVFDRWNREKAIDGQLGEKKKRLEQLKQKLADLQAELKEAQEPLVSSASEEMSGYVPQSASMAGYVPYEAGMNQAYSSSYNNPYAVLGAQRPNVRF